MDLWLEHVKVAWQALRSSMLRTLLTALSVSLGAGAIALMVSLSKSGVATITHGIDAVVEIFDEADLALARESGARIIQVNARDLDTLQVDRSACLRLAERFHQAGDNEAWIAASGISASDHLRQAAGAGYQAVLVGTSLMDGGAPGAALKGLLER